MRRWLSDLAVLRERDFLRLFLGQSVSVIGDGITPIAITYAVLDLTGSATDLGLVLAAQSFGLVAFALVGGVWADRLRREWVMIASDVVRMLVVATAAALLIGGWAQIWSLALVGAAYGAAEAFFRPALGGLVPQIVPAVKLQQANALLGLSENAGWFVGPALAGLMVAGVGPGVAIALDAGTFLASIGFLLSLRVPPRARVTVQRSFVGELLAGWREVRSRTWLWVMLLRAMLVLFIVVAPFQVLGPLALRALGQGAGAWGLAMAALSAGMIVGSIVALRYSPRHPMLVVALTGATAAAAPFVLAVGGGALPLVLVQAGRGVAVGVLVAVWMTTLQREIPEEALSRVTAWDWMASMALWPAGLAIAGPLADAVGVRTACALAAGLGVLAAGWVFLVPSVRGMQARSPEDHRVGSAPPHGPDGGPSGPSGDPKAAARERATSPSH